MFELKNQKVIVLIFLLFLTLEYIKGGNHLIQYKTLNYKKYTDNSMSNLGGGIKENERFKDSAYQHLIGSWRSVLDSSDIILLRFYPDSNQLVMSSTDSAVLKYGMSRGYLFPISYSKPYQNSLHGTYMAWGGRTCTLNIKSYSIIEIEVLEGKITYKKISVSKNKSNSK